MRAEAPPLARPPSSPPSLSLSLSADGDCARDGDAATATATDLEARADVVVRAARRVEEVRRDVGDVLARVALARQVDVARGVLGERREERLVCVWCVVCGRGEGVSEHMTTMVLRRRHRRLVVVFFFAWRAAHTIPRAPTRTDHTQRRTDYLERERVGLRLRDIVPRADALALAALGTYSTRSRRRALLTNGEWGTILTRHGHGAISRDLTLVQYEKPECCASGVRNAPAGDSRNSEFATRFHACSLIAWPSSLTWK